MVSLRKFRTTLLVGERALMTVSGVKTAMATLDKCQISSTWRPTHSYEWQGNFGTLHYSDGSRSIRIEML